MNAAAGAAGYSGTPLVRKFDIGANSEVLVKHAPNHYRDLHDPILAGVRWVGKLSQNTTHVHRFCVQRADLAHELAALRQHARPQCAIWVSMPKKAAKA